MYLDVPGVFQNAHWVPINLFLSFGWVAVINRAKFLVMRQRGQRWPVPATHGHQGVPNSSIVLKFNAPATEHTQCIQFLVRLCDRVKC